jgi:hypothetical protein
MQEVEMQTAMMKKRRDSFLYLEFNETEYKRNNFHLEKIHLIGGKNKK